MPVGVTQNDGNFLLAILASIGALIAGIIGFFLGGWLDPFESSSKDSDSVDHFLF